MSKVGMFCETRLRRVLLSCGGAGAALVFSAGCVANPSAPAPSSAPAVSASPVASPSPSRSLTAASVNASATPAVPAATTEVSPPQQQVGTVMVSLALESARHMLGQNAAQTTDQDPAHQAPASSTDGQGLTALVLDGLVQLTNNIDPSQTAPDDQPQAMLRHVRVQILGSPDAASSLPYLSPSLDVLLDGHPVLSNVALEPMVAAEATTPDLYYGNNLKLVQRGTYQVFVRVHPSAVLRKDGLPTAEFSVVVR